MNLFSSSVLLKLDWIEPNHFKKYINLIFNLIIFKISLGCEDLQVHCILWTLGFKLFRLLLSLYVGVWQGIFIRNGQNSTIKFLIKFMRCKSNHVCPEHIVHGCIPVPSPFYLLSCQYEGAWSITKIMSTLAITKCPKMNYKRCN